MLRPWPGNVRELLAQVKRAAAHAAAENSQVVRDKHLDPSAGMPTGVHPAVVVSTRSLVETLPARPSAMIPKMGKGEVLAALEANAWNIAATQRALSIPNRTTLIRLIEKFELTRPAGTEEPTPE